MSSNKETQPRGYYIHCATCPLDVTVPVPPGQTTPDLSEIPGWELSGTDWRCPDCVELFGSRRRGHSHAYGTLTAIREP